MKPADRCAKVLREGRTSYGSNAPAQEHKQLPVASRQNFQYPAKASPKKGPRA